MDLTVDGGYTLHPYDHIVVPRLKDATAFKTVTISGEVKYPGTYRISDQEHISDLIERAGGTTPEAYFFGVKYTSQQAAIIQQKSIDSLVQDLEIKSQQALSETTQTALSDADVKSAQAGQEAVKGLINKLKGIKAEGRVAIKLSDLTTFRGSKYDFPLADGDTLLIPKQPNFVATTGNVFSPSAYLYEPNKTLNYYLTKSGGPTKTADKDYIYILRANGEVISKASGSGSFFTFTRFSSIPLMPGDTIVVPENFDRIPYMRLVKDIADIMFKVATTAGVAIAAL